MLRLKDFKLIFILSFIILLMLWMVISFLAMGYEQGTDLSSFGKSCYEVAKIIHFSLSFWQRLFSNNISFFASFVSSGIILSLVIFLIKFLLKLLISFFKDKS